MTDDARENVAPHRVLPFFLRWLGEPNAIWMREVRQAARAGRHPWALFVLLLVLSLLVSLVGLACGAFDVPPAKTGHALFQVFFSLAFVVVGVLSPAVGASSMVSETEGRTWDAIFLSGQTPKEILRGKFLSSLTVVALYVVGLAPVGALAFVLGGVAATEVAIAFFYLLAFAILFASFGLAMASSLSTQRGALVVTLLVSFMLVPTAYGLGPVTSAYVSRMWSTIHAGTPVWLPLAYVRAPWDIRYVVLLLWAPLVGLGVPSWFFYETAVANLTPESGDRSTRRKVWFVASAPCVFLLAMAPVFFWVDEADIRRAAHLGQALSSAFVFGAILMLGGEPPGPTRRITLLYEREGASRFRRWLGPNLPGAIALCFGVIVLGFLASVVVPLPLLRTSVNDRAALLFATLVVTASLVFFMGVLFFARARGFSPWGARFLALGIGALLLIVPFILAVFWGIAIEFRSKEWLSAASLSPLYAFVVEDAALNRDPTSPLLLLSGGVSALVLLAAGVAFCLGARVVARKKVHAYEEEVRRQDAALASEAAEIP